MSWLQPTSIDAEPPLMLDDRVRSTYELVETCILTLLLCSWTSIHLDTPGKSDRSSRWDGIWKKAQWTATGILLPELILWMAFAEYWEAKTFCFKFEQQQVQPQKDELQATGETGAVDTERKRDNEEYLVENAIKGQTQTSATESSTTVAAAVNDNPQSTSNQTKSTLWRLWGQAKKSLKETPLWPIYPKGLEVGFFIEMGGLEIDKLEVGDPADSPESSFWAQFCSKKRKKSEALEEGDNSNVVTGRVTSSGALFLQKEGLLPDFDIAQIKDQSKSDFLTKVVVCLQASWMIVQCIARDHAGLPVTLLELNTVMHVMCALFIYILWFKKPQDLRIPKIMSPSDATKDLSVTKVAELRGYLDSLEQGGGVQLQQSSHTAIAEASIYIGALIGLVTSAIYGGVHLTVWHGHFPSRLERVLWRISNCIIAGMPLFLVLFLLLLQVVREAATTNKSGMGEWRATVTGGWVYSQEKMTAESSQLPHPKWSWNLYANHAKFVDDLVDQKKWIMLVVYIVVVALQTVATVLYIGARAYVIVEAFLSLRSLPKGAYQKVPWVDMIPHF